MRVLITGGAGFVSSHLAEALLARGDEVHALDNLSTGSIDNIGHLKSHHKFGYTIDTVTNEPVLAEVCRRIEAGGWLAPGGLVYLEAPASAGPPELPEGWSLLKSKRAGEVGYHLARRDSSAGQ